MNFSAVMTRIEKKLDARGILTNEIESYSLTQTVEIKSKDVQRIDVLVDPDQVVPDPVRQNNALSWKGTMNGDNPSCDVVRS